MVFAPCRPLLRWLQARVAAGADFSLTSGKTVPLYSLTMAPAWRRSAGVFDYPACGRRPACLD
jgi:hypothetical protein